MSDKTTAAIAAEQKAEIAEAPADVLPAVTLDELEQVDIGAMEQGERPPFRITDDRCADWAIRKIAEERSEYNRLKELADQQKAAIEEKVEESAKWGELKKLLAYTGEIATIQSTGEIVEGVTAYETPATFTVDI